MTAAEREALPAGRELDERVAEMLGWAFVHAPGDPLNVTITIPFTRLDEWLAPDMPGGPYVRGFHPTDHDLDSDFGAYSTDMGYAWTVVEHLVGQGWDYIVESIPDAPGKHRCEFWHFDKDRNVGARADTAAHAICLAALRVAALEEPK